MTRPQLTGPADPLSDPHQEVKDHIFEPVFTTKGMGAGPGLGLSSVYGVEHSNIAKQFAQRTLMPNKHDTDLRHTQNRYNNVDSTIKECTVIRVLFICLGNICRSPMAEAVFQHLVDEAGLSDQIEVDSAGTMHWNMGRPAHRGTRDVLLHRGIAYDGRARQVDLADLTDADYVIAMDTENVYHLRQIASRETLSGKLYLLLDFAPPGFPQVVPDPIYDGKFEHVYRLVEAGCNGLLDYIRAKHGL